MTKDKFSVQKLKDIANILEIEHHITEDIVAFGCDKESLEYAIKEQSEIINMTNVINDDRTIKTIITTINIDSKYARIDSQLCANVVESLDELHIIMSGIGYSDKAFCIDEDEIIENLEIDEGYIDISSITVSDIVLLYLNIIEKEFIKTLNTNSIKDSYCFGHIAEK